MLVPGQGPVEGAVPAAPLASLNHRGEEPPGLEIDPLALALADPRSGVPSAEARIPIVNASPGPPVEPAWQSALIAEVVRRVAWGGDRRRGVARLELGGALAGTSITVEGEGREVSVDIVLGPGGELGDLPARLAARFAARGLTLRSFEVR